MATQTDIKVKTIDKKTINITGVFNTVFDIAQLLDSQHGFDIDRQQLIFTGKVLQLEDNLPQLDEKAFIVLLMKKEKKKQKETKEETQPTIDEIPQNTDHAEPDTHHDNSNPVIDEIPQNPDAPPNQDNPTNSNPSEEQSAIVNNLVSMGFDINHVNNALQIANNNPEVALSILTGSDQEEVSQITESQQQSESPEQLSEQDVIQLMQENPEMFQQLLANICQGHPDMANMIQSNPQVFVTLLTQILNQQTNGQPIMSDTTQEQQSIPEMPMSEEEKEIVTNLHAMFPNIPKITILETLKACDNDESMTANLLYDY
jgi:hypothetical protein